MSTLSPSEDPVRGPFSARLPAAASAPANRSSGPVAVTVGERRLLWDATTPAALVEHATTPAREVGLSELLVELAGLDESDRHQLLEQLVTRCGDDPGARAALSRFRDVLRSTRLPVELRAGELHSMSIEVMARLDEHGWYLRGWLGATPAQLSSMTLVSPIGERIELTVCRYPRPDVDGFLGVAPRRGALGCGFAAVATTRHAALEGDWLVELAHTDGELRELRCPDPVTAPSEVRRMVLGELVLDRPGEDRVLGSVLHDALQRVERTRAGRVDIDVVDTHGDVPGDPEVSVIVPLYGRLDFLEHQLAQFAHDPQLRDGTGGVELIYVLDQPEHTEGFRAQARRLHRLYRVPMRIVTLTENAGFSGANNLGASLASGRLLLLCNSDVLPLAPGWLGELVAFHDDTPGVGAVAPRLVFEDGSLQHAGMYFARPDGEQLWSNEHYFKGLAQDFAPALVPRPVPAVTAACLLTERALFEQLGGLSGQYLQGDYEDSDYCLRVRSTGRDCWYAAHVPLLHLEGMSYAGELRSSVAHYNQWLHTRTWDGRIAELMSDPSSSPRQVAATLRPTTTSTQGATHV